MPTFILTHKALEDLKGIGRYTGGRWGQEQRNRYLGMLDRCFHDLSANPLRGNECHLVRSGYRKYHAGRHVIYYQIVAQEDIKIVRILHASMVPEHNLHNVI
ncbi:MAG: type II toxin-antitoxin system RelE/ParE family toxin [Magnetococcales bacterium]|nr:type II toxin-antitoxin system RelE/ParE family toxin [Magnetococcales bacterium]